MASHETHTPDPAGRTKSPQATITEPPQAHLVPSRVDSSTKMDAITTEPSDYTPFTPQDGHNLLGTAHSTVDHIDGFSDTSTAVSDHQHLHLEPIAICGIGLRLPGGIDNPSALFEFLIDKKDARKPIPAHRFNLEGFYSSKQKLGSLSIKEGYFLESDLDRGDAGFFSTSKAEYELLDPQQRMLLEVTQEALQDACERDCHGKDIRVYAGIYGEDWHNLKKLDLQDNGGIYRTTGHGDFVLANRVSYEYDLHGSSMTIGVGCSSSMVGLHLACEAIQRGDCSGAIVGGTNIIMSPLDTMEMLEHGVLSLDASVKAFDAAADGYARGEAINAIYIKKLDDAIRDGNTIRAVIRGTASNSDGKTAGMSLPSQEQHEVMIGKAYKAAGIEDFGETAMVECHGTGTKVGDPREVGAVAKVIGQKGVFIGSVKPNVGHSEGASGITSLVKAVLSLENRVILPKIKFNTPNPKIAWKEANLKVRIEPTPFPEDRRERISIQSFGLGGANAHVIVESAAEYRKTAAPEHNIPRLLVFSAKHPSSLEKNVENHRELVAKGETSLRNLSYTLGAYRSHTTHRTFAIANGRSFDVSPSIVSNFSSLPIFVFTRQGAQLPTMGKELMKD